MTKRKAIIIIGIFTLAACSVVSVFVYLQLRNRVEQANAESGRELQSISQKLGVNADWLAVREYVYCKALKKGMTQIEVEEELLEIASFNMRLYHDAKQVYFSDRYTARALSPLILSFDNKGLLQGWGSGEGNFGPRATCEGKQK